MLNKQQQELTEIINKFCDGSGIFTILGAGGVGKTYTVCHLDFVDEIYFLAPTHKAKSILFQNLKDNGLKKINIDTTSRFFGWSKEKDENNNDVIRYDDTTMVETISNKIILDTGEDQDFYNDDYFTPKAFVIDEISMIKSDEVRLIKKLSEYFPIILLGDGFQIPPVKEKILKTLKINGSEFKVSTIFDDYFLTGNGYKLTEQVRQRSGSNLFNLINSFRNNIVKSIEYKSNLKRFVNNDDILWMNPYSEEFKNFVRENNSTAVSYTNITSSFFNFLIGKYRSNENPYYMNRFHVGDDIVFNKFYQNRFESVGNEMIFNPNHIGERRHTQQRLNIDRDFTNKFTKVSYKGEFIFEGVTKWNGEICFGSEQMKKTVREFVYKKRKVLISVNRKHLNNWYDKFKSSVANVSKTFGITAHKSQGSSFENVVIPIQDFEMMLGFQDYTAINRILYVAMSRAVKRIVFVDFNYDWNNRNYNNLNEYKKEFIASRQDFKCAQTDKPMRDFELTKVGKDLMAIIK